MSDRRVKNRQEGWRPLPMVATTRAQYEAMADRALHSRSTLSATSGGLYSYGFSYRTWRFS
jgi:hypothetical protein